MSKQMKKIKTSRGMFSRSHFPLPFDPYLLMPIYLYRTLPFNLMTAMEDAMRKTIESYVVDSKRLELKEKIGSGD